MAGMHALDELTQAAQDHDGEISREEVSGEETTQSRFLYGVLVQLCSGHSWALLRAMRPGEGFAAWNQLC